MESKIEAVRRFFWILSMFRLGLSDVTPTTSNCFNNFYCINFNIIKHTLTEK